MNEIDLTVWDATRRLEWRSSVQHDNDQIFVDGIRVNEETQIVNSRGFILAYDLGESEDLVEDTHAGCQAAYEREKRRGDFLEARLNALVAKMWELGSKMDGVDGHTAHSKLGDKTLGGAVREIIHADKKN